MPATRTSRLRNWLTDQQQLVTLAAILVALPASYAFRATFGEFPGSFLLLVLLGVFVPTAYDDYWPRYDRTWKAVAWTLVACAVTATVFVGGYLVGEAAGIGPLLAGLAAFLVTSLGGFAVLAARGRD
jgi:hypothetical protein